MTQIVRGRGHIRPSRLVEGAPAWCCSKCTRWLPASAFHRSPRTSSGLRPSCAACERDARRRDRAAARELRLDRVRARLVVATPVTARRIEARGVRRTIREWSIAMGLSEWTIRDRLRRGWPAWKAVTVRARDGRRAA
jgi:hypothetical protein